MYWTAKESTVCYPSATGGAFLLRRIPQRFNEVPVDRDEDAGVDSERAKDSRKLESRLISRS
jgi:hypothetical protein